ncbi:MAG: hypothetical protein CPSOU_6644 [uncultured Paraburkholderia sp.]|nr:MAG: hypothetical protein CPSOU_6644 [uncultured Paraburkholderia sp.]
MEHEYANPEKSVFWLHVAVALLLLLSLQRGKNLDLNEWLQAQRQALTVEFSAAVLLPEVVQQSGGAP